MAAISPSGEPSMKKGHADRPLGGPGTTDLTAQRCDTLHASPSPCFVAKQDAVSNTASFAGPLGWMYQTSRAVLSHRCAIGHLHVVSGTSKVPHCTRCDVILYLHAIFLHAKKHTVSSALYVPCILPVATSYVSLTILFPL